MKFLGVLFCVQTHVAADEDLIGMMCLKRPSVAADNWQHRRERDSSVSKVGGPYRCKVPFLAIFYPVQGHGSGTWRQNL